MNNVLLYAGSAIVAVWGIAHLVNTRGVLSGFGPMSPDTRRVVAMEWIMEGLTLNFIAVLVVIVTAVSAAATAPVIVYRISAGMLIAMAVVSLFTGARVAFWAYKLCPVIFGTAAVLLVVGSL